MFKLEQNSIRKNRVVVDIRDFNKIIEANNYFMSLQTDITSVVTKRDFINLFDATVFLSMKRSNREQT